MHLSKGWKTEANTPPPAAECNERKCNPQTHSPYPYSRDGDPHSPHLYRRCGDPHSGNPDPSPAAEWATSPRAAGPSNACETGTPPTSASNDECNPLVTSGGMSAPQATRSPTASRAPPAATRHAPLVPASLNCNAIHVSGLEEDILDCVSNFPSEREDGEESTGVVDSSPIFLSAPPPDQTHSHPTSFLAPEGRSEECKIGRTTTPHPQGWKSDTYTVLPHRRKEVIEFFNTNPKIDAATIRFFR